MSQRKPAVVNNIYELAEHLEIDHADISRASVVKRIQAVVYDGTECGAHFEFYPDQNSVQITSIVEGSDACFVTDALTFPFETNEFDARLEEIEELTQEEFERVLDKEVFDHPAPWEIRTEARMMHEGDDADNAEHYEELTEIMASDGTTVGYMTTHQLAEIVVNLVNKQWG